MSSEDATEFLAHAGTRARYKPWELEEDLWEYMDYELEHLDECSPALLMEELHAAAYRHTLGQSLFASRHDTHTFNITLILLCQFPQAIT